MLSEHELESILSEDHLRIPQKDLHKYVWDSWGHEKCRTEVWEHLAEGDAYLVKEFRSLISRPPYEPGEICFLDHKFSERYEEPALGLIILDSFRNNSKIIESNADRIEHFVGVASLEDELKIVPESKVREVLEMTQRPEYVAEQIKRMHGGK